MPKLTLTNTPPNARSAGKPATCQRLWWASVAVCLAVVGSSSGQSEGGQPSDPFLHAAPVPSATPTSNSQHAAEPIAPPPEDIPSANRGDRMVEEAIERLGSYHSIQAKLRQQVNLFDNTLVGTGGYRQLNLGPDLLMRMELKIQLENRAASFQQIYDGRFLWSFVDSPNVEELGSFRKRLSRIDMDVVRKTLGPGNHSTGRVTMGSFGAGGIPGLLTEVARSFKFEPPLAGILHGVDVWIVTGTWRPSRLRQILRREDDEEEAKDPVDRIPPQMPHQVHLVFGRNDLFPYRFEYRRKVADADSTGIVVKASTREIATLELFEVQIDAKIDATDFVQQQGNLPVEDATEQFLLNHQNDDS